MLGFATHTILRFALSAGHLLTTHGYCGSTTSFVPTKPQNFVFFELQRTRIREAGFLESSALVGAQLKYTWPELEPQPGAYHFSPIERDLAFLKAHGKKLFIQLQDVTFDSKLIYVPSDMLRDPQYHGGATQQFDIQGDDEGHAVKQGWVARRWDPAVANRFHRLLRALGKEFDGRIEGITLPETAVEFGDTGRLYPLGFTPTKYRDAIVSNMAALKAAFPKSVAMIYANFMPGEWEPAPLLASVYTKARALGVGVGGPDMIPYKSAQLTHSYPLIRASHGFVPTGLAVQEGDYQVKDPKSGRLMNVQDLYNYGEQYLHLDYLFWCTEEPYFSKELLPFMRRLTMPGLR